jgi:hypothetical protein
MSVFVGIDADAIRPDLVAADHDLLHGGIGARTSREVLRHQRHESGGNNRQNDLGIAVDHCLLRT